MSVLTAAAGGAETSAAAGLRSSLGRSRGGEAGDGDSISTAGGARTSVAVAVPPPALAEPPEPRAAPRAGAVAV
ncbi:MAG TPA: hypothetical protein VGP46_12660, partial [Acidimicrobiales bacterium]|nr:hypothetical protein [Acidimicrobiales bacterium]